MISGKRRHILRQRSFEDHFDPSTGQIDFCTVQRLSRQDSLFRQSITPTVVDELEVEPLIGAVYFITHHHVAHPMCMRSNLMLAASFGHHLCQGESL